jgi:CBS domain-containing protein
VATLSDVMKDRLVTVPSGTSVAEAAAAMTGARVGSALVVTGTSLLGILTERDVMRAAASGSDLTTSAVGRWMTKDPITAEPNTDADEAATLMLTHGFRHLPVLDGARLVGVVSLRDALSARVGTHTA